MTIAELEAGVLALEWPDDIERIVTAIKTVRARQQSAAASEFAVGDRVKFNTKGTWIVGTVEKINTKSLSLTSCRDLMRDLPAPSYRVAPTLCMKVRA